MREERGGDHPNYHKTARGIGASGGKKGKEVCRGWKIKHQENLQRSKFSVEIQHKIAKPERSLKDSRRLQASTSCPGNDG